LAWHQNFGKDARTSIDVAAAYDVAGQAMVMPTGILFRVGADDAEFLVKQFEPVFDQNDLLNIDNLNAYAKILINGQTSKPFNIRIGTASWNGGDKTLAEKLKEYSRTKYGADRQGIEDNIYKRLRE